MNVFFKTAVLTAAIFLAGILFGLWIERTGVQSINNELSILTLDATDNFLQSLYIDRVGGDGEFCEAAIRGNLEFNQKIYSYGVRIEELEESLKISGGLNRERIRYAMLQFQFWMNSIRLKEVCNAEYTNVVYFFTSEDFYRNTRIDQWVQSNVLWELKKKCGDKIMMVPLPIDLGISSINVVKYQYDINETPFILIDEKIELRGVQSLDELEQYVNCSQTQ